MVTIKKQNKQTKTHRGPPEWHKLFKCPDFWFRLQVMISESGSLSPVPGSALMVLGILSSFFCLSLLSALSHTLYSLKNKLKRERKKKETNRLHKLLKGREGRFVLLVNSLGVNHQSVRRSKVRKLTEKS